MAKGQIIQSVDVEDVIKFNLKKASRLQAVFLSDLESIIDKDSEEFTKIRKLFLDISNAQKRAFLSSVFGDIED